MATSPAWHRHPGLGAAGLPVLESAIRDTEQRSLGHSDRDRAEAEAKAVSAALLAASRAQHAARLTVGAGTRTERALPHAADAETRRSLVTC
jgi:hypothetical protein